MKLLVFSDLHGNIYALDKLKKKAKKADIIICAGDISIFENDIRLLLEELNNLGKTVLIIHGNHEDEGSLKKLCSKYKYIQFIHERFFKRNNILFIGYGGGGFRAIDDRFEKETAKKFKELMLDSDKSVLVLHGPPYKTTTDKLGKEYVGNKSYRRFIEKNQPNLVVCGHIHENFGKKDKIGKSFIINPGPEGKIIDL